MTVHNKLIAILGPTASGKTALAVALARHHGGQVVNCDAMQVYADVPTLTAQPTAEEKQNVPHHLFGLLDGADTCTAARYAELARPAIAAIRTAQQRPIICGGTGLYFKVLTEGIAAIPPIPAVLHEMTVALHADIGGAALRERLMAVDPVTAERLKDGDTQRLIRAWDVYVGTGTPLSTWQRETHSTRDVENDWHAIILLPPRDALYDKINRRFTAMLERGALNEVRALLVKNIPATAPVLKANGVPELSAHLRGEWSLEQATARAQQVTRNYAKRQITWFTNTLAARHPERCTVIRGFGDGDEALRVIQLLYS